MLSNMTGMLSKMRNKMTISNIAILVVTLLLIGVGFYVYYSRIRPALYPTYIENNEYEVKENMNEDGVASLYLFHTTWCPHCKKAMPEWNKFKAEYADKQVGGKLLKFVEVDCDKDEATASKFKIEGYPTIKLVIGEQIVDFDAKPTYESLKQFIDSFM